MKAVQIQAVFDSYMNMPILFVLYDNGVIRVRWRQLGEEAKWQTIDQEEETVE